MSEVVARLLYEHNKTRQGLVWSREEQIQFGLKIAEECAKVCIRTGILELDESTGQMYARAVREHFESK